MPRRRAILVGAALACALLPRARVAAASPAFARKYNVSCHACHDHVHPELNAWGRRFQENGYQLPEGAEPAYRDRDTQSPGTIDERIGLLREIPLAARAVGVVEVPVDPAGSNRNSVNLRLLHQLYLIGGGSLYKNISVFFSGSIAPAVALHHATIGVHNLIAPGALNVRAGSLLLLDFLHPEHRGITRAGNLAATLHVGLNPTTLDNSHLGIEVYGRLLRRQLFYELAVVQGAQGADGVADLDSNKDVFAQVQWHFRDLVSVGALGYFGRTQITDRTRLVQIRFTDPFFIAGGEIEARVGPVMFFGYGLYGRHENPKGSNVPIGYVGMRAEVRAAIRRDLLAQARFDAVFSSDDPTLERRVATAALTYLLLTNLKLSAEFDADALAWKNSTAYVVVDVAM